MISDKKEAPWRGKNRLIATFHRSTKDDTVPKIRETDVCQSFKVVVRFRSKDSLQAVCYKVHSFGHLLKGNILKAVREVVRSRKRSKYPLRICSGLIVKKTGKESPAIVQRLLAVVLACHGIPLRMISFL